MIRYKDHYLYRAVDKDGDTLEFMLSEKRDEESAFKFLKKAIGKHGLPECITIDKSGANESAIILLNCMLYLMGLWPYYGSVAKISIYLFFMQLCILWTQLTCKRIELGTVKLTLSD